MSYVTEIREPDEMGVWCDHTEKVWLPRSIYPKRTDAIRWAMREWGVGFTEIRCRSRFMRYTPHIFGESMDENGRTYPGWTEDRWSECDRSEPGAFPVWRLEEA